MPAELYGIEHFTYIGITAVILGAFQIGCLGLSDAFHIYTPLISGTPLTTWVMAPMYAVCYALLLLIIELVRKHIGKKKADSAITKTEKE